MVKPVSINMNVVWSTFRDYVRSHSICTSHIHSQFIKGNMITRSIPLTILFYRKQIPDLFFLFSFTEICFNSWNIDYFEDQCGSTLQLYDANYYSNKTIDRKRRETSDVENENDHGTVQNKNGIGMVHGLRLKQSRYVHYHNDQKCYLTFTTTIGHRLLLTFRKLLIEPEPDCNDDYLELFDGNETSTSYIPDLPYRLCGSITPKGGYSSTGPVLTMFFRSDSWMPDAGFDVIVTSFHEGSCNEDEFRCTSGKCIHHSLVCDDFDNCGDSSDERCQVPTEVIIFIIIATALGIKLTLIVVHYIKQQKKIKQEFNMSDASKIRKKSQVLLAKEKTATNSRKKSDYLASKLVDDKLYEIANNYKKVYEGDKAQEGPRTVPIIENPRSPKGGIPEEYHRFFHY
ncbi:hypothetical protein KUTeg_021551 [Tegillarca granosa]|uniref:CUB domain-containing protein n=1 Tax=Tegillarca granosa TaxID=220873 RepID=A0ABQ9E816_TEGGR|nr:hypothetical protein KUTeg_021551 [Tegillarca granosa]